MKRRVAIILTFALLVSLLPMNDMTAKAATNGLLTYEVVDGEVTITGCDTSATGELVIPETMEGYPVTSIGVATFYLCSQLKEASIGNGVTTIGDYAFNGCDCLFRVNIGEGVTTIGEYAFRNCLDLTYIRLGESVTNIEANAFARCDEIREVWYSGTEETSSSIQIQEGNEWLTLATWHYNTCKEEHVYINDCDNSCEQCDWIREVGHENVVATARVEASCTEAGNAAYWTCADCGGIFCDEACAQEISLEDTVIPSTGHAEKILPAKEATITSTGLTEGKVCSVCDDVLVEQEVIDKLVVKPENNGSVKPNGSQTESKKNSQVTKPKASKLTKVTGGKKKITVKFKKISGIDGYEIQVALKKNFKSGKKTYNVKASAKSYVAKKLKGGKKYFVRIRTYKKVNGENIYSKWSTVKKVKTKK